MNTTHHAPDLVQPLPAAALDVAAAGRIVRRLLFHLVSFETVFVLYLLAGHYKAHPLLAPLFPIDPRLLFMVLSVGAGSVVVWRQGIYRPALYPCLLFFLFAGWAALSLSWSPGRSYASTKLMEIAILNSVSLVGGAMIIANRRVRVYRFLVFLLLFALFFAVDTITTTGGLGHRGFLQDRGSYLNTARSIAWGAIICFVGIVHARPFRATWLVAAGLFVLFNYALMIVGARSPLLFMAIVLLLPTLLAFGFRGHRLEMHRGQIWVAAIFLAAVLALNYILVFGGGSWTLTRMQTLFGALTSDGGARDGSASARLDYWDHTIRYWAAAPIFGRGLGSFPILYLGIDIRSYSHNLVLETLMELGIIGLALLLLSLAPVLWTLSARRLRREPVLLCLLMLFLHSLMFSMVSVDLGGLGPLLAVLGMLLVRPPEAELAFVHGGLPPPAWAVLDAR
ncbi:MAG TPA: O-antigen ligase family protein [Geminicoccaceae bacterium]|nr:O-antigen ligase family protein [Geminicoccaceae bacterium]